MKKILLSFVLTLSSLLVFSQKIDLDRYGAKATFLQIPNTPVPLEYTTFSTKFIANGINLVDAGYSNNESDLESLYFQINGFKRVANGGHFTIKVQIDGYDMGKAVTEKKESTTKDKDGKESITVSYKLSFKYFIPIMFTITDFNGKILKDGTITDGTTPQTYESSNFSTAAALEKYWGENAVSIKKQLLGKYLSDNFSVFQTRLNTEIGFTAQSVTDILWITDSPKHPENESFRKACEETKLAIEEMTVTIPLNKAKVTPILLYFENVIAKYTNSEKPERKLRYASWYNMATIYYWLEDFDNAIRCSDGLITNDYDKSDGEILKATFVRMKGQIAKSFVKSCHFVRDISNASPPKISTFQEEEELIRQNALRDKAMREAAEREVTGQGSPSVESRSTNILNSDESKEGYVANAKILEKNKKYDDAIKYLTKALVLDANDSEVLTTRGNIYVLNLRQFDNAIADFNRVIELIPNSIKGYNGKAFTYWMMHQYEQSIIYYRKITELEPQKIFAYSMICDMYNNMEKFELAAQTYTQIIKISPIAEYYNGRGWALSNAGKFKEAIPDFDKAIELDPKDGVYYKNRGNAKNKLLQFSSALEDLTIAVKKRTNLHYKSLSNKGDSYFGLGKYKEALENYEDALKIRPDFQEAINGKKNAEAKLKN
ncbi:MAG: tetratricopeptide repeat protein [Flectobacillus sp.]|nr:tetratricopeptide repeat protein [Flectobacillus sp.]